MSRTIVITGAANGMGRATADRLRAAGDTVIGIDLAGSDIDADLATVDGRESAIRQVLERTDTVHGLVLCAGVTHNNALMVSVNYFGVIQIANRLRPLIEAAGGGNVVIVSSASGTTGDIVDEVVDACLNHDEETALVVAAKHTGLFLYPSTKRALAIWTRRTAIEPGWADQDITVNAIAPGVVQTGLNEELLSSPEGRAAVERAMPQRMRRGYMTADHVAPLLNWLVSAENTHVTGQMIHIDGGVDVVLRGDDVFAPWPAPTPSE